MTVQELSDIAEQSRTANAVNDFASAEIYARQVLEKVDSKSHPQLYLIASYNLVQSLARRGMSNEALPLAQGAYHVAEEIDGPLIPELASAVGHILKDYGNYSGSLNHFAKALIIYEERQDQKGIARVSDNIGLVYAALEDFDRALEYYQSSLRIKQNIGGTPAVLSNMGRTYALMKEFDRALEYFEAAYNLLKNSDEKLFLAAVSMNMAIVYRDRGEPDFTLSAKWFNKAMTLNRELGDRYGELNGLLHLAILHNERRFGQRDTTIAEDLFKQALAMATEMNRKPQLIEIHRGLQTLFEEHGRWQESLKHMQLLYEVEKEVKSEESKKQAVMLDFNRKEAEAEREQQIRVARFEEQVKMLHNTLPKDIAGRMVSGETQIADFFEHVTVLFTDFKGFTALSEKVTPKELVKDLHECFSAFDRICEKYGIEKIKTIGDAYMAAGGLPSPNTTHAQDVVKAALEMREVVEKGKMKKVEQGLPFFEIRIGVHTGPVVAGIVGVKKFQYDIWGDTVNTASRMESSGEAGKVNVSQTTYELVKDQFTCEYRGEVEAKGKGKLRMYFISKA